jgi:hypothetical protein
MFRSTCPRSWCWVSSVTSFGVRGFFKRKLNNRCIIGIWVWGDPTVNRAIVLRINNSNFITKHLLLTPSIGRFLYLNTKKKQIVTGVNFDIGASLLLMTHNRILRRTQEDFNDVVPGIIPAIRMSLFRLF